MPQGVIKYLQQVNKYYPGGHNNVWGVIHQPLAGTIYTAWGSELRQWGNQFFRADSGLLVG